MEAGIDPDPHKFVRAAHFGSELTLIRVFCRNLAAFPFI